MLTAVAIAALLPFAAFAQTTHWQTFQQSLSANDADTTYFAFRGGVLVRDVSPDSIAITPPENVVIDEDATITMRQVSGTVADSIISYCKLTVSVDGVARIVHGDSLFLFGSTFAAPSTANTFGDGRLYGKSITGLTVKRANGVAIITKVFDLSGGVRKLEWGLGTK